VDIRTGGYPPLKSYLPFSREPTYKLYMNSIFDKKADNLLELRSSQFFDCRIMQLRWLSVDLGRSLRESR
jgi:hypothetical protein